MKKKTLLTLQFILFLTIVGLGQVKKKPTVSKQLEIDKLYETYKDQKTVTLVTSYGNVEANVEIKFNAKGKPWYISFSGRIKERLFLKELYEELMTRAKNSKIKEGYRKTGEHIFTGETYSKGNRMVSFYGTYTPARTNYDGTTQEEEAYFSITTYETTRQDPSNDEPFKF